MAAGWCGGLCPVCASELVQLEKEGMQFMCLFTASFFRMGRRAARNLRGVSVGSVGTVREGCDR